MPKMVFFKSFTKFGWVCGALLEFKSRPKFDEGIFESYVYLNLVVLALTNSTGIGRSAAGIIPIDGSASCSIIQMISDKMNTKRIIIDVIRIIGNIRYVVCNIQCVAIYRSIIIGHIDLFLIKEREIFSLRVQL